MLRFGLVRSSLAREKEFVEEGIRKADIKEFLRDNLQKAKFGGVDIRRTALRTRMIIYAERPGLVIGRRGRNIKDLTEVLEQRYGFDNLQIEVEEIPIPELSPHIMASRIAAMLKAGRPFRRSAYMNLSKIMEAGAKGVEITISGKIRGERSRTVRFVAGAITKCGEPAKQVQEGLAVADLKQGMMGIKVKIMPPNIRMPDQVDFDTLEKKAAAEAKEAEALEAEAELPPELMVEAGEEVSEAAGEEVSEAAGEEVSEAAGEEVSEAEAAEPVQKDEQPEEAAEPEKPGEPEEQEALHIEVRDVPEEETPEVEEASDAAEAEAEGEESKGGE
jgi:small subunit ribosomal protein S3